MMQRYWFSYVLTVLLVSLAGTARSDEPVSQPVKKGVEGIRLPDGFVADQVFEVPRDSMGSWVSLAEDGQGRLLACDQGDKGIYRITPGDDSRETQVEKMPVQLTSVQGMQVVGDVLYAVVNGNGSGLYRVTDTTGDGRYDKAEKLITLNGGGEHGPHAVRLSPEGDSLYVVCGNHTQPPENIERYRVPKVWGEDHLLPQLPDPNGHAVGIMAPAGYIIKCDMDGKQIELVSNGYRNAYDMDFNADGELFAYDADMEWDMGLPWYRPTRLCHATSGSEFGWRNGSGKWPVYYEDSLPPVVDIGPGSPTGAEFGYGLKFPAKFQKAMYLLDWTFGTMYAVTLTPDGATYTGTVEEFLSGKPLPLTDCAVGQDGALYFTTGGRGTQSYLYRVRYLGDESTEVVDYESSDEQFLRHQRREVEKTHGISDAPSQSRNIGCIEKKNSRFLAFAGRIAQESRSAEDVRTRFRSMLADVGDGVVESYPIAVAEYAIGLARHGESSDLQLIAESLARVDLGIASERDQSAVMRAMALAAIRLGPLTEEQRLMWLMSLRSAQDEFVDYKTPIAAQWYELMVYLKAPEIVELGVAVMDNAKPAPTPEWGHLVARSDQYGGTVAKLLEEMPPMDAIEVAFILRNAKVEWNEDLVKRYFAFFPKYANLGGGNSYNKYLNRIRDDAMANLSPKLQQIASGTPAEPPASRDPIEVTEPKGPGREWNKAEALKVIESLDGSDFASGRNLFHATGCIKCHRFAGEGDAIGPELSSVSNKFSKGDLLDALLEPSKTISDQYGSHQVITTNGKVLVGRVVEADGKIKVYTSDYTQPPVELNEDDIDEMTPSKVSQMSTKLCDKMNEQEFRDLVAYLMSGGNENAPYFKKQ